MVCGFGRRVQALANQGSLSGRSRFGASSYRLPSRLFTVFISFGIGVRFV